MKRIRLKVEGMHCTACAMNIDGELEDIDGVKQSNTNYAKQITEVEFDEKKLDVKKVIETIKTVGYVATILS